MGNCKSYQCKQMHVDKDTRIAALEAQLAEAKRFLEMALDYEGDVFGRYHNDVVDLISTKAGPPARAALKAAMEARMTDAREIIAKHLCTMAAKEWSAISPYERAIYRTAAHGMIATLADAGFRILGPG